MKNVFDQTFTSFCSAQTVWKNAAWKNEENEFAALTFDFENESLTTVGVIRIKGKQDNNFYYTYSFQVWGKRKKSDGTINKKSSAFLNYAGNLSFGRAPYCVLRIGDFFNTKIFCVISITNKI